MKVGLAGLAFGFLVACSPEPTTIVPLEIYRDTTAQIASQTNVTADRMAGQWTIRQKFAQVGVPQRIAFVSLASGDLQMRIPTGAFTTDGGNPSEETHILYEASGPGRWTPNNPHSGGFSGEIWVMWMDFDSRTAAIGTPSGEFGWIMDRNPTGGGDRIIAARDIMDWFGYDVSRLEEVRR